jgi:hypothetical protein
MGSGLELTLVRFLLRLAPAPAAELSAFIPSTAKYARCLRTEVGRAGDGRAGSKDP